MFEPYMVPKVLLQDAGIPIVSIETKNNQFILDKENWVDANIKIENAEDESWNMEPTDMQIRGRGNTTWGCAKKPFAIKFDEKTKICGMPKHKRWVLIANYFDHTQPVPFMQAVISRIFPAFGQHHSYCTASFWMRTHCQLPRQILRHLPWIFFHRENE